MYLPFVFVFFYFSVLRFFFAFLFFFRDKLLFFLLSFLCAVYFIALHGDYYRSLSADRIRRSSHRFL